MALLHSNLDHFHASPAEMDARLRRRISPWELFALALAFCSLGIFRWALAKLQILPFDYNIYILTAKGDLLQFYYADWSLPFFWLWAKIPFWWGYILWNFIGILTIFCAARIFGGNATLPLLTFQMFYTLFLGQIVAILVGGLAIGWWAMAHRRWNLAGLGFFIASTKFQIGIPFGFLLWLAADVAWRERLRILLVPIMLAGISLIWHPGWPLNILDRIRAVPPYDWGSISLWRWLGPATLILWLLPLVTPLTRQKRFIALAAACPLVIPYFQSADLLVLYVLPVGWLPVMLGNLGFLFFQYGFQALPLLWVVPMSIYLAVMLPALVAVCGHILQIVYRRVFKRTLK